MVASQQKGYHGSEAVDIMDRQIIQNTMIKVSVALAGAGLAVLCVFPGPGAELKNAAAPRFRFDPD